MTAVTTATPVMPPPCRNMPRRPATAPVSDGARCMIALFVAAPRRPCRDRSRRGAGKPDVGRDAARAGTPSSADRTRKDEADEHRPAVARAPQGEGRHAGDRDHADRPRGQQGARREDRDAVAVLAYSGTSVAKPSTATPKTKLMKFMTREPAAAQQAQRDERVGGMTGVAHEHDQHDGPISMAPGTAATARCTRRAEIAGREHDPEHADAEQRDPDADRPGRAPAARCAG